MENKNQPAFPVLEMQSVAGNQFLDCTAAGLSKREHFAGLAMQGLLSCIEMQRWLQTDSRYTGQNFAEVVAINSVEFADSLLTELSKPQP